VRTVVFIHVFDKRISDRMNRFDRIGSSAIILSRFDLPEDGDFLAEQREMLGLLIVIFGVLTKQGDGLNAVFGGHRGVVRFKGGANRGRFLLG
jgi:hypothetical protein